MSAPESRDTWASGAGARRLVLALIVLLPLLGLVPNIAGYMVSDPPRAIFLGFRHLPDDHHQYATFIAQARQDGRFFMHDLLTPEPHPGRFVALYPWVVGRLAAVTGLPDAEAWLLLQYPAGVALLLAAWLALGRLTRNPSQRLTAFLLATLAAGADWLFARLQSGMPLLNPAGDPFATYWNWNLTGTLALPLWATAQALLLILVALLVDQIERPSRWRAVLMFPLAPLCWAIHPYTGLAALVLAAALPLAIPARDLLRAERPDVSRMRERVAAVAPVLLAGVVIGVEHAWASRDPVFAAVTAGAFRYVFIMSPLQWPVVYTLPLILGWFGWRACHVKDGARDEVLLTWLLAVICLSLNLGFSGYKFQYLVTVPACALAARGVQWLSENVAWCATAWRRRFLPLAVLAVASIGTFSAPFAEMGSLPHDETVLASEGELAAMEFLRAQAPGVVIVPPERGAIAAWKTLHPVHYGHYFLTIDPAARNREAGRFLDPATSEAWRLAFLTGATSQVRWVLVPPRARGRIGEESWGAVAFDAGGWRVVEVLPNLRKPEGG